MYGIILLATNVYAQDDLFYAILGDKIATFIAGAVVLGSGLITRYIVTNWLAGRRLKNMGFQYNNKFTFKGIKCEMVNIFSFKTIMKRLDTGEISSPIQNIDLENEIIWMDKGKNGDKKPVN